MRSALIGRVTGHDGTALSAIFIGFSERALATVQEPATQGKQGLPWSRTFVKPPCRDSFIFELFMSLG
jgi:hypothetical protein